jgi:RND family efflux transporter MFP subunit
MFSWFAVVAVGLLTVSGGCRNSAKPRPGGEAGADVPRVQVQKPAHKKLIFTVTRPGQIEAFERTPLFSKVEGYVGKTRTLAAKDGGVTPSEITELAVYGPSITGVTAAPLGQGPLLATSALCPTRAEIADIGEHVKEGEVLAEVVVPELVEEYLEDLALLKQARAGVEQAAKTTLVAEKFAKSAEAQVVEAQAGVLKAEGTYQFALSEHQRISELAKMKSVPKQLADEKLNQLKAAEAAQAEAKAKVESTKAMHAEAQAKIEKAQTDQVAAAAQVQVAEAKVGKVKALLEYTKIRAPYDGIVTERYINTGDFVRPPQGMAKPLYVVARTDTVRVFVDMPETEAALVRDGDDAVIQVQALKGKEFKGPVTRNAGALDPVSHTLKTEIDLPNKTGTLLPGMYVVGKIKLQAPTAVLTVPVKAVVQEGNKAFVCCVADGKVIRREVTTGLQAGGDIEILTGLTGAEDVVRENAAALKDGQTVTVVTEGAS